jgi:integrase
VKSWWLPAIAVTGLSDIDFHDLRHAGNRLVADAEANLRELMERMGHASSRAALIYLHSTNDRQRTLGHRGSRSHPLRTRRGGARGTGVAQTDREAE